jgi:hypothetical protein
MKPKVSGTETLSERTTSVGRRMPASRAISFMRAVPSSQTFDERASERRRRTPRRRRARRRRTTER